MTQEEFEANLAYLKDSGFVLHEVGNVWDNCPFSAEIENYTDAGGDMMINLEVVDKEHLEEYIDNFDINDEVISWWRNGKNTSLPFNNIREHYNDVEQWLSNLEEVCDYMPY